MGITTEQHPSREEVKQPQGFEKIDSNQRYCLVFGANLLKDGEFRYHEEVDPPLGFYNIVQQTNGFKQQTTTERGPTSEEIS